MPLATFFTPLLYGEYNQAANEQPKSLGDLATSSRSTVQVVSDPGLARQLKKPISRLAIDLFAKQGPFLFVRNSCCVLGLLRHCSSCTGSGPDRSFIYMFKKRMIMLTVSATSDRVMETIEGA
jgi:hypothetical protein